jgi:hypothetical protein
MAAYRILRGWVAFFLAGYFVLGLATAMLPQQEVFPVYSWFLFPLVPGQQTRYALRLREARGQKFAAPLLYQDAEGFVANPHSVTVDELVQQLGLAVKTERADEQQRLRQVLEKNYLPSQCQYELVAIVFDPLVRWRTGQYEIRPIAQYQSSGETP